MLTLWRVSSRQFQRSESIRLPISNVDLWEMFLLLPSYILAFAEGSPVLYSEIGRWRGVAAPHLTLSRDFLIM